MIFPGVPFYRLSPRGGGGLACDEAGVALGPADLVLVRADAMGRRRCEVQPSGELGRILGAAYGPQPEAVVLRLHRGLQRAAAAIEAGNLCLAGNETVLFAIPDPTPPALARLAKVAELAKWERLGRISHASQPGNPAAASGRTRTRTKRSQRRAFLPMRRLPA